MSALRIYLDHNASSPLRPQAREAMLAALGLPGNASSIHAEGRAARAIIERARRQVAALVGGDPSGVVFTASATEAANVVLTPSLALAGRAAARRLLVGTTEHACVRTGHRFAEAQPLSVDGSGVIDLGALEAILGGGEPALVALQVANNETGVLQPIRAVADLVHRHDSILVCDAVQAVGRMPLTFASSGADVLILSSHKLGGPKGAGALVFANPDAHIAAPLLRGGGQERGFRAGTEDVAAIAGFGAACEAAASLWEAEAAAGRVLRDGFEAGLADMSLGTAFFGAEADRLPNTSCFAVPGVPAATLLMALDLAGIAVSSGSACSSGKVARSHVLDAMQIDPYMAESAIRVSFGRTSEGEDVATLLKALAEALPRIGRNRAA